MKSIKNNQSTLKLLLTSLLSIVMLISCISIHGMCNKRSGRLGSRRARIFCRKNCLYRSSRNKKRNRNRCIGNTCSINNQPLRNNPQPKNNTRLHVQHKSEEEAQIKRAIEASLREQRETVRECTICFEDKTLNKFSALPCGHVLCMECQQKITKCPYCRKPF